MFNMRLHSDNETRKPLARKGLREVYTTKIGSSGRFIRAGYYDADGNFVKSESSKTQPVAKKSDMALLAEGK